MPIGHAEISGAGVAGLIAAAALAQRGWTVRVHERAPDLRNFGAGISCWYNFVKVLKAVDAYQEAQERCRPFYIRETRDERDRVLYTIKATEKPGERTFSLTRRDLLAALANAAQRAGVEIVTSSPVIGADADGALLVEGGRRYPADLVIGADGVNSPVRDALDLLKSRKKMGQGAIRLLIPRTEEEKTSERGKKGIEYWSGARRLYYTACNPDEVYLAFMLSPKDREGSAVPINKESWIRSFPFLEELISRVGDQGRWDEFEEIALNNWSRGRACVVGDGAHAMAPNIGQGGGMASVNALALAVHVTEAKTVEEGLATWERVERPLTDYTQRISNWYGRINDVPAFMRAPLMVACGKSKWIVGLRQKPANHTPTGYVP
ncbi:FAD-dependent monooxygenase [Rhodovarius crocodyli]|uniref:FAD-dependent monooxygenase n=1 Tax=Rhodovarius crocodyli TaxID=1979269 RepID=A0A437M1N0_9PROT|nr:NAD(P)/FAD-dependent oxidoreductase [Rhodovarius crocodyli]RVT91588.1 FAD-dependent monooxygenase [Rhodovarius crocodyli]